MELANAYTELNDPDLQEALFKTQLEGMAEEDSMARMDHDFVRALRYAIASSWRFGDWHRPLGDVAYESKIDSRHHPVPAATQRITLAACELYSS